MAIEKTVVSRNQCCGAGTHEAIVFFNEDNLNYIPILLLPYHDTKELDAFIPIFENSKNSEVIRDHSTCIRFACNWRGAKRYFVLPASSTNPTPPYDKFLVSVKPKPF